MAFASTELDKRRRSTEGVNTSPDSGLGSDSTVIGTPAVSASPEDPVGLPRTPSPNSPQAGAATNGSSNANANVTKYSRQSDSERHHFKKKFFHRDWNNAGGSTSKFRPKGKDWDWNNSAQWPSDEQS